VTRRIAGGVEKIVNHLERGRSKDGGVAGAFF
jgi:hypothetical protein